MKARVVIHEDDMYPKDTYFTVELKRWYGWSPVSYQSGARLTRRFASASEAAEFVSGYELMPVKHRWATSIGEHYV